MRLGLYGRLAISLSALLCVALLTLGYLLLSDADQRHRAEQLALAQAQARTLAEGSMDALVSQDYELLERWVRSVLPADYYAYAFLSDPTGLILTHTDLDRIGHRSPARVPAVGPSTVSTRYLGRPVQEVVEPVRIGEQHLADAHVAYYLDGAGVFSNNIALKIIAVLLPFLLLLLFATLILIRRHTRPLARLAELITATSLSAAKSDHMDDALLNRRDEVGALAREYQALLARLRASFAELHNEEQRLRDMVEERTQELQEANRELQAFSYSVSHDLRAPLRAIGGFSRALLEDYETSLDETAKDYLKRICRGANRMGQLIDDLLLLSRVTRQALKRDRVDLSLIAKQVMSQLQSNDSQRRVELVSSDVPEARGDAKLLRVLLENLIGNAWKYSAGKQQARIEFGADVSQQGTVYFVRDNGAGFDMRYVDKLFGVFQRLHRDEEFEGTGIGLATVQRIVNRHGGRVWAEAEVGKGAVFYFTLGAPD